MPAQSQRSRCWFRPWDQPSPGLLYAPSVYSSVPIFSNREDGVYEGVLHWQNKSGDQLGWPRESDVCMSKGAALQGSGDAAEPTHGPHHWQHPPYNRNPKPTGAGNG